MDRLLIRRKRVTFRVLYNSKVGIGPELLHLEGDHIRTDGQMKQLAALLERMSVVVVRIRNTGSYDIRSDDFEKPLSFTFGGRVIRNARISDASDGDLRKDVRAGLEFFAPDDPGPRANAPTSGTLTAVRDWLPRRTTKGGAQAPNWRGVRLRKLDLARRQRFKLVVLLVEPKGRSAELTKEIRHEGKLGDNGLIRDDKVERRVTLPRVTGLAAAALTGLLLVGLALAPSVAEARKSSALNALTLDNKTFDTNSVIESGYQFWTVEYLYLRAGAAVPAAFSDYLHHNETARIRLTAAGYIPCTTPGGAPQDLCNHR